MRMAPVRIRQPLRRGTETVTVPDPVPVVPEGKAIQLAVLVAVHEQPAGAVTEIAVVSPARPTMSREGVTSRLQAVPPPPIPVRRFTTPSSATT